MKTLSKIIIFFLILASKNLFATEVKRTYEQTDYLKALLKLESAFNKINGLTQDERNNLISIPYAKRETLIRNFLSAYSIAVEQEKINPSSRQEQTDRKTLKFVRKTVNEEDDFWELLSELSDINVAEKLQSGG